MKMFAIRNKENGKFYRWEELCSDGYGHYVCDVGYPFSLTWGLPAFFDWPNFPHSYLRRPNRNYSIGLDDHCSESEVEFVEFELTSKQI